MLFLFIIFIFSFIPTAYLCLLFHSRVQQAISLNINRQLYDISTISTTVRSLSLSLLFPATAPCRPFAANYTLSQNALATASLWDTEHRNRSYAPLSRLTTLTALRQLLLSNFVNYQKTAKMQVTEKGRGQSRGKGKRKGSSKEGSKSHQKHLIKAKLPEFHFTSHTHTHIANNKREREKDSVKKRG